MSTIDEALAASEAWARDFTEGHLTAAPARKLVVVACMDARLQVEKILGLKLGDAHVIRNAGGIVTEDVIRSLVISNHLLFTQEIMIINHTSCGLLAVKDDELRTYLQQVTGAAAIAPSTFHSFTDLDENVRQQIRKVKSHPWIPDRVPVRGFVYDVATGRLREVFA